MRHAVGSQKKTKQDKKKTKEKRRRGRERKERREPAKNGEETLVKHRPTRSQRSIKSDTVDTRQKLGKTKLGNNPK